MTHDDFLSGLETLAASYPVAESDSIEGAFDVELDDSLLHLEWTDAGPGVQVTLQLPWPFDESDGTDSDAARLAIGLACLQRNWQIAGAEGEIALACLPESDVFVAMWTIAPDDAQDPHRFTDALRENLAAAEGVWVELCAIYLIDTAPEIPEAATPAPALQSPPESAFLRP